MTPTQYVRKSDGSTVEAVQLTPDNGADVWEWVDSKPFYAPDGSITGLSVFTRRGRAKAEFGDWIVRDADCWSVWLIGPLAEDFDVLAEGAAR